MTTSAKVSELKARLSGYLAQVRQGETVTVCDRSTPIARIVPLDTSADGLQVREATHPEAVPKQPVARLRKRIDLGRLLRADRDAR